MAGQTEPVAVMLVDEEQGADLFLRLVHDLLLTEPVVVQTGIALVALCEVDKSPASYLGLVRALCRYNLFARKKAGGLPGIYAAGLSYREANVAGRETYSSIVPLLSRGYGDCADLVAARCSEEAVIRRGGEPMLALVGLNGRGGRSYHATVRYRDGSAEDPADLILQQQERQQRVMSERA